MELPKQILFAIKTIMNADGKAFLVGGALRDFLLNRPVNDFDIATSLTPNEIKKIFKNNKTYSVGQKYGTVTVLIDNLQVEITTFRGDSKYKDNRHPESISFVSNIEEDLGRRDFTINAMAYNPFVHLGIIDPFQGMIDLDRGIINTVRNANERFAEDALRMMRGIRLSAQLNFDLSNSTLKAIIINKNLLENISVERINSELNRILLSDFPEKGLALLQSTGILYDIFKTINESKNGISPLSQMQMQIIKGTTPLLDYRLTMLLYNLSPEANTSIYQKCLKDLRYSKTVVNHVVNMIDGFKTFLNAEISPYNMRKLLGSLGIADTKQILSWAGTRSSVYRDKNLYSKYQKALSITNEIIKKNEPILKDDLAINGLDVISAGIGRNNKKHIGKALDYAYDLVLQNPQNNKRDILLNKLIYKSKTISVSDHHGKNY